MDSLEFTTKLKDTEKKLLPLINDSTHVYKVEKCGKLSTDIRNKGNKLYNLRCHDKKIHLQILMCYTKCISYAPSGSEELAMGYSNRSMLLFHLEKYENCLVDVERALLVTQLNWLRVKLLVRKVECMVLGELYCLDEYRSLDVWKILNDAKCLLNNVDGVNIKIKDDLKMLVRNAEETAKKFYNKYAAARQKGKLSKNAQFPSFATKGEIPCGSDAIALKYCDEFGRHLTATRDINAGEILLIEDGFLYLHPPYCYMACSHCLEGTYNGIPCNSCVFAVYCSEKCKEDAWISYHDKECTKYNYCKILKIFMKSETIEVDKFIIMLMLLKRVLTFNIKKTTDKSVDHLYSKFFGSRVNQDKRTRGLKINDKFDGLTLEACGSLVSRYDEEGTELDLMFLPFVYMLSVDVLPMESDSDFEKMLHLTTQALEKFIGNSFVFGLRNGPCVCETDKNGKHETDCISQRGIILAPYCSLVNHSCVNNANYITVNGKMVLYAERPIKANEQIFINYGWAKLEMPKSERQYLLSFRYRFTCKCEACRENWPVPTQKEADEADAAGFSKFERNLSEDFRHNVVDLDFDKMKLFLDAGAELLKYKSGGGKNFGKPELAIPQCLLQMDRRLHAASKTIHGLFAENNLRTFMMKCESLRHEFESIILKEVLFYDEEYFTILDSCKK